MGDSMPVKAIQISTGANAIWVGNFLTSLNKGDFYDICTTTTCRI